MKKNSRSGVQTSPGTPDYGEMPKSWCSERVPLPSNSYRRHISSSAFVPFNSGRTLPSKWDDAERWITSPISGHASVRTPTAAQPQRRPKSKSGPLGEGRQGLVYYSPSTPTFARSSIENSPLTTGLSLHYDGRENADSTYLHAENMVSPSIEEASGLSDVLSESSVPSSQDGALEHAKDEEQEEEALVWNGVHHKDMATQISPEGSIHSSSKGRLSFSTMTSSVPGSLRSHGNVSSKDEVKDVQVDRGSTTARHVKKRGPRKMKNSNNINDLPTPWNASEASKLQREEAKITAWENLQTAKAEASIRKLEMNLEKKRGASMDKIMKKLRSAQMKAEALRNELSENLVNQTPTASNRKRRVCVHFKAYSFRNCFSRGGD